MSSKLVIVLNGESQLEYHRDKVLPEAQRAYLDRLDRDMGRGIEIGATRFDDPDLIQRAQFMAINLIQAVRDGNEAIAAASCAYLADRLPDLKQVRAVDKDGQTGIDLIFDREFSKEVKLNFVPRDSLN